MMNVRRWACGWNITEKIWTFSAKRVRRNGFVHKDDNDGRSNVEERVSMSTFWSFGRLRGRILVYVLAWSTQILRIIVWTSLYFTSFQCLRGHKCSIEIIFAYCKTIMKQLVDPVPISAQWFRSIQTLPSLDQEYTTRANGHCNEDYIKD